MGREGRGRWWVNAIYAKRLKRLACSSVKENNRNTVKSRVRSLTQSAKYALTYARRYVRIRLLAVWRVPKYLHACLPRLLHESRVYQHTYIHTRILSHQTPHYTIPYHAAPDRTPWYYGTFVLSRERNVALFSNYSHGR